MKRGNMCPYFIREKRASGTRKGGLYCELARFNFKDAKLRRAILYEHCLKGGSGCSNKAVLDDYYNRENVEK